MLFFLSRWGKGGKMGKRGKKGGVLFVLGD